MDLTTLEELLKQTEVVPFGNGIRIFVKNSWVVSDEDRLSYTTIIRLVECCREYHWECDVKPILHKENLKLDSITRAFGGDFYIPIPVDTNIEIHYRIEAIREKSYKLIFEVKDESQRVFSSVWIICVFYDPDLGKSIIPNPSILEALHDKLVDTFAQTLTKVDTSITLSKGDYHG